MAAVTPPPECRSTDITVVYLSLLLYVAAIYIRPGEIVPGWGSVPFLEILASVAAVVAVLSYLRHPRPWTGLPHDGFVLGFWLAIVVSNLASGWLGGAVKGFAEFFRIAFYYFLMRFAVREPRHFRGLIVLVIGLSLLHATNGIVQYQTGHDLAGMELMRDGRIRGVGIFNDPNDLALAFVMVVPLLVAVIGGSAVRAGQRLLGLTALSPILLAIGYTASRGAVVGLGAIVVAFSLWRFGRVAGAAAGLLSVVALLAASPRGLTEVSPDETSSPVLARGVEASGSGTFSPDASSRERIETWSEGLTMLQARPLFGVGYSRFTEYHELVAHNSFIHTFAELGIFGAFFGIGMVYWFFRGLRTSEDGPSGWSEPAGDSVRPWARALTMSGIGVLTTTAFLSRQYDLVLYTLFGLGACHAAITGQGPGERRLATTGRDLRNILLLTAGGLVATKLVVTVLTRWTRA